MIKCFHHIVCAKEVQNFQTLTNMSQTPVDAISAIVVIYSDIQTAVSLNETQNRSGRLHTTFLKQGNALIVMCFPDSVISKFAE